LTQIHPSAVIDSKAEIGEDVQIGPFAVIEADVKIGDGCEIHPHAVIASGTTIGSKSRIFSGAVIGTIPQDLKFDNEKTFVSIGENTTCREYATVNRGTNHSWTTRVGDNCLLMAYSHTAHDCQIGNNVVIANAVNMAGHVVIEDHVGVGGMCAIHQFVHIGDHSFIGGMSAIKKDVPPYILAMGDPLTYGGLNSVGLSRRGFTPEVLSLLKKAYKVLYRQNLTIDQAVEKIEQEFEMVPELSRLLDFLKGSERGIIR